MFKEDHMLDMENIHSLTDFNRNTRSHLARLKASGLPTVLTVNGKAEIVVQEAVAYQELLRKAEFVDSVLAVQKGLAEHDAGKAKNMRAALSQLAAKAGLELKT